MTTKKIKRTSRLPLHPHRFITVQDHAHPLAAVAFDLDSTLTKPYLDFTKLRAELGLASRGVVVLPDSSPGVGVDARPELVTGEWHEKVAQFKKRPVRDDSGVASRQSSQWMTYQEPYLASFLARCESRVGIQVVGQGCSALTDALEGFGPRVRGTEANLIFYVHNPQQDIDEGEDVEL